MKPSETVRLVALVRQIAPAQKLDEYTPDAWHLLLEHVPFEDALEAVKRIGRRQAWIAPADIIAEVKVIRRDRTDHSRAPFQPSTDDPRQYIAELRAHNKAIADGEPQPEPVELPERFKPAELVGTFRSVAPVRSLLPAAKATESPRTLALMRARLEKAKRDGEPLEGEILPAEEARP